MNESTMFVLWEVDIADHEGIKEAEADAAALGWILDHPDFGAPR